jgi:hypothetical protein
MILVGCDKNSLLMLCGVCSVVLGCLSVTHVAFKNMDHLHEDVISLEELMLMKRTSVRLRLFKAGIQTENIMKVNYSNCCFPHLLAYVCQKWIVHFSLKFLFHAHQASFT